LGLRWQKPYLTRPNVSVLAMCAVKARFTRRAAVVLSALVSVSTFLTIYSIAAYNASGHVYVGDDTLYWTSAPSGSFLFWPRSPGMLEMLSEMNETDSLIYRHLIIS